jgi:predicted dienelactone hydrolase
MRWILTVLLIFHATLSAVFADEALPPISCGFQEYQWADSARNRLIKSAMWYPTPEQPKSIAYGPFQGHAAAGTAIVPGRHPLILISHGSGGHRFNQFYLAEVLASHGFIVLAVQHPGNCLDNNRDADLLVNLWNRPRDISFVLDQALQAPGLADHIDPDRIGVMGHSLGGYTALVLVGAQPDIGKLDQFCGSFRGRLAKEFCDPKADELDAWRKGDFLDFSHLRDLRFRAAFVMAPGVPLLFDKPAMGAVFVPIYVFLSGRDEILKGRAQAFRQYLPPTTTYMEFPEAGHYVYLETCPDEIKHRGPVTCIDIGTSRTEVHPILKREAIAFFNKVLRPLHPSPCPSPQRGEGTLTRPSGEAERSSATIMPGGRGAEGHIKM